MAAVERRPYYRWLVRCLSPITLHSLEAARTFDVSTEENAPTRLTTGRCVGRVEARVPPPLFALGMFDVFMFRGVRMAIRIAFGRKTTGIRPAVCILCRNLTLRHTHFHFFNCEHPAREKAALNLRSIKAVLSARC